MKHTLKLGIVLLFLFTISFDAVSQNKKYKTKSHKTQTSASNPSLKNSNPAISNQSVTKQKTDPVVSQLFDMLVQLPQITDLTKNKAPLIVKKSGFCATNDCAEYFKYNMQKVLVMDEKELAAKKLHTYIVLDNVVTQGEKGSLDIIVYKNNQLFKTVKMK